MSAYEFSRTPQQVPLVKTEHRLIQTAIPALGTEEVLARLDAVESRSMHGQLPIVWYATGPHWILDIAGNRFIDFTSGIFVSSVGHSNDAVLQAIGDIRMLHAYAYPTLIRAEYLEKLTRWSGFEKAFLLSSGTEATEHALRLMRLYGLKVGKRRLGIVCIDGNYHGRTLGAQMMNGKTDAWIGYQDPNIHQIPFPYPWAMGGYTPAGLFAAGINELGIDPMNDICGFMLETFQGWGALFYPLEFVQAIERFCRAHDILLCFDEMQAGFGRTGKKFGYKHYGVMPDLICVGKAMGGGVPLSGVLGRAEIMDLPETGSIISTHSANPLACAAGLAVLQEIEWLNLVKEAERKGVLLTDVLAKFRQHFPSIAWISGAGLIAAIVFKNPEGEKFASRVAERCMQKGLLVAHTGRESIKIGPPLTIPDDALLEGVQVIGEAISEIESEGLEHSAQKHAKHHEQIREILK